MRSGVHRILIVSASIGAGHNQAAAAIAGEWKRQVPNAAINIVDFMAGENSYVNGLLKEAYFKMLSLSPHIYDYLYRWSHTPQRGMKVQHILGRIMQRNMRQLVDSQRPDLIIATHPFPCGAAAYLKQSGKLRVPLVGVITDFTAHQLWVHRQVDRYFVACPEVEQILSNQGVARHKIQVSGIPIAGNFAQPIDVNAFKTELRLDSAKLLVLVMGGGLGLGGVEKALQELDTINLPFEIAVVAGKNHELFANIAHKAPLYRHAMKVLGFTDKVPELMECADVLITKPGALTISEALVKELPMLLFEALPGQEEENAEYIHSQQAGIWVQDSTEFRQVATELIRNNELRDRMKMSARKISQPRSATAVVAALDEYLRRAVGKVAGI